MFGDNEELRTKWKKPRDQQSVYIVSVGVRIKSMNVYGKLHNSRENGRLRISAVVQWDVQSQ